MGRGRQKAKQTKVARALKYSTYEPNLHALEQELASRKAASGVVTSADEDSGTEDSGWDDEER